MSLKGARFTGTFDSSNNEAFSGVVWVNKANIPASILSIVGRATVPSDGEWHEVSPIGSCKLVARMMGAAKRYGVQHYGYYDCCKKATVELTGHATYGTSRASMPNWGGLMLDSIVRAVYGETCGKPVKVRSWTRTSMNTLRVVVDDTSGNEWELNVYRHEPNPAGVHWHLLNGPSTDELIALLNRGTDAFA